MPQGYRTDDVAGLLLSRVEYDPFGGCWLWNGGVAPNGYGIVSVSMKQTSVHRAAWKAWRGEIPDGLHVCHRCDVRCCINPDHLFLGTHSANMQDALKKGRFKSNWPKGKAHPHSRLDAERVSFIRVWMEEGYNDCEIARAFGVSSQSINSIRHGKSWKTVN